MKTPGISGSITQIWARRNHRWREDNLSDRQWGMGEPGNTGVREEQGPGGRLDPGP